MSQRAYAVFRRFINIPPISWHILAYLIAETV